MPDVVIYGLLMVVTSIYAVVLDRYKELLEPDGTWIEVVIGTTICLAFAAWRGREVGGDWRDYETGVWLAFIFGGLPVVVWQVGRMLWRYRNIVRYARRMSHEHAAAQVAEEPGSRKT